MSVHQKKNGTWYVQYRVPGERSPKCEYFGVGDAGEQKARIRDAEIRLLKTRGQELAPTDERVYLDTVAQAYMTDRKLRGASSSWLDFMKRLLNETVLPALTKKPVDDYTYTDVMEFIESAWGKNSLATRQRYVAYLRAVFKFGVDHKLTSNHPLAAWKKTKEKRRELLLTLPDLEKLIAHASPDLAWALEVEWEVGARPGPSELYALRYQHVNFEECTIHIPGTKTHASDRIIPITPHFRDRLLKKRKESQSGYIIEYKGMPVKGMHKGLKRAAERAGLPYRVNLYQIRHLFASAILAGSGDLAAVARLLGHAQIQTTQTTYYHLLKGEMARATRIRKRLKIKRKDIQKDIQGGKKTP